MWQCADADSLRCSFDRRRTMTRHRMPHIIWQSMPCRAAAILILLMHVAAAHGSNVSAVSPEMRYYHGSKYTITQLLSTRFTTRISDDIDMDPCKASMSHDYRPTFGAIRSLVLVAQCVGCHLWPARSTGQLCVALDPPPSPISPPLPPSARSLRISACSHSFVYTSVGLAIRNIV